jgi:hypothetical protein
MPGTSAILCTGDTCRFASLKHIPLHPKWCLRCQKTCLLGFGGNWNSVGQSAKMFESNPFKSCVSMQTLGVGESNGTHVCHFVLPFSGWLAFLFLGDPNGSEITINSSWGGAVQPQKAEVWARKVRFASRVPARGRPRFFERESVGFVQHTMRY